MHSLVLSQCSEIPHKLSSDIQELLCSWATICTGASSCQYRTIQSIFFCRSVFSQYIRKKGLIFKAALHVLPGQNRPSTNLNRGKNEKGPTIEPCGTLRAQNNPQHPLQSHRGKIFQEASVHLRKCLSLAGLDMTLKRRRGRSVSLDFVRLACPTVTKSASSHVCTEVRV